jgi:hypothetical protein
MTAVATAIIGSAVIGAVSAKQQSKAVERGTKATIDANERAAARSLQLLSPFIKAGEKSLASTLGLVGLNGQEAQKNAIQGIRDGPEFQMMKDEAQEGFLAAQSATGSLRGGNTKRGLAEITPSILSGLINQQVGRLGFLTQMGQASAAGQAAQESDLATASGMAAGQGIVQQGVITGKFMDSLGKSFGAGLAASSPQGGQATGVF